MALQQNNSTEDGLSFLNLIIIFSFIGSSTSWLAEQGCHVTGVDPDEKRIKVAKKKYTGKSNVGFIVGKSIDFPLIDIGYNLIVCNYVMHWLNYDEKMKTYKRVYDALQNGGIFASVEMCRTTNIMGFGDFLSEEMRHRIKNSVYFTSVDENQTMFSKTGFEIVTLEEYVSRRTFTNPDVYFRWIDASLHGAINTKEIHAKNKGKKFVNVQKDGTVVVELPCNKIIVRKPGPSHI